MAQMTTAPSARGFLSGCRCRIGWHCGAKPCGWPRRTLRCNTLFWVAVKKLELSYHNSDNYHMIKYITYPCYGTVDNIAKPGPDFPKCNVDGDLPLEASGSSSEDSCPLRMYVCLTRRVHVQNYEVLPAGSYHTTVFLYPFWGVLNLKRLGSPKKKGLV